MSSFTYNPNTTGAMRRYGGRFVRKLGAAMDAADPSNYATLARAFPAYIKKYEELGERDALAADRQRNVAKTQVDPYIQKLCMDHEAGERRARGSRV